MIKTILNILVLVLCIKSSFFAQEGLKPLTTNINYIYGDLKPKAEKEDVNTNQNKKVSLASGPIFFDDFSYAYKRAYPDQSLWSDSLTYVNTTSAIAPWSIGVATFDGLNKRGYPYTPALNDLTKSLPADTLTSRAIDLSTYTVTPIGQDSLALIFYYQARGRGEAPETTDTLLLDFYNPLQGTWSRVWYQRGNTSPNTNDTVFKRGFVRLDSAYYRNAGFKFRFRNKATTAGNYDHWHLDYVMLDINRSIVAVQDSTNPDFAFGYIPTPYLKNYAAMPWKQFDSANDVRIWNSVFVRNNGVVGGQLTYKHDVYDNNNVLMPASYTSGPQNAAGFFKFKGWFKDSAIAIPKHVYKFPNLTAPADFKIQHVIFQNSSAQSDVVRSNDTVLQHQTFSNFYAFDDGSAEGGYYINGFGGRMAGKYTLKTSDTLLSVKIYFDQVGSLASQTYKFRIYVWQAGSNGPSNIVLRRDSAQVPHYFPTGDFNTFSDYSLSSPLVLTPGTYYIGIRQEVASGVVVGFDRNLNHSSSFYYDSGNGWTQSSIYGSIMIRPVFGSYKPVGIAENKTEKPNVFSIYPNPASSQVTIRSSEFEKGTYNLINAIGQNMSEGKIESTEQIIATENLSNGLYFLILKLNGKIVQQNKIIIQH